MFLSLFIWPHTQICVYALIYVSICLCIYAHTRRDVCVFTPQFYVGVLNPEGAGPLCQCLRNVPRGQQGCQRGKGSPCLQAWLRPPLSCGPHTRHPPDSDPVRIPPLKALTSLRHSGCLVPLVPSLNAQPRGHVRSITIRSTTPGLVSNAGEPCRELHNISCHKGTVFRRRHRGVKRKTTSLGLTAAEAREMVKYKENRL